MTQTSALRYRQLGRALGARRRDLLISGAAAGLAWLTKSPPLILAPMIGLLAVGAALVARYRNTKTEDNRLGRLCAFALSA